MSAGTMLDTIGVEPLGIEPGRCVAALDHKPHLSIGSGVFHAGTIVTLADSCATYAALTVTDPEATMDASRFPLAVQISVSLVRITDHGRVTAEARVVHGGRTTQVVETRVTDEQGRLMATVTTTHIVVPAR